MGLPFRLDPHKHIVGNTLWDTDCGKLPPRNGRRVKGPELGEPLNTQLTLLSPCQQPAEHAPGARQVPGKSYFTGDSPGGSFFFPPVHAPLSQPRELTFAGSQPQLARGSPWRSAWLPSILHSYRSLTALPDAAPLPSFLEAGQLPALGGPSKPCPATSGL